MTLTGFDISIIAGYFVINVLIGLAYRKLATESTAEYFVGGRNVSWWLAGTSMVATTFAADTPLAVTGLVASYGIAGNWLWWSMCFSNMLTVFCFAKLWRRAGVLTDVEFAELRYGGRPAAFLRGFRALYLGLPINCIILGWVNLAMVKILMVIFPITKLQGLEIVFAIMLVTALISTLSGLWGVLVTDLFQFVLKMGMVIALAIYSVRAVGGLEALRLKLTPQQLSFTPDVGSAWMPMLAFFVYIAVNWWATWYPGSEPGGGGYVAQRIFCAKNEKHSVLATLWFSVAHYALRPWPWILTALCSLILYPTLADKESGFIKTIIDPTVFPASLRGLMIAAFAAAYMSTIATQLNWGASYLVNDVYRRFLVRDREDAHYVRAAQLSTLGLMVLSAFVTYYQDSISGLWRFLIAIGAGTGSVFILRWYWWWINAWSEVSAMAASFLTSITLLMIGFDESNATQFAQSVLITVLVSTCVWLSATFLTGPESYKKLLEFYSRVRPNALLWGPIAQAADFAPSHTGLRDLSDWILGVVMIYAMLFGTGKIIFGAYVLGFTMIALSIGCATLLYLHLNRRGWKVLDDR